ncbi:MAG: Rid family detoxifying hydrolase [Anaerolineales bacterium]|nr:Rid family detoxifying hydrolase [Anaerolineales bacterium]
MSSRKRKVVVAEGAPKAIGPYSVAIRTENFIFASGSLGVDPATGEFAAGGVEGQTRQALKNLAEVLKAGGSSLEKVVKTTVFLQDMAEFALMNAVYAEFFPREAPARSTVEVAALPKGAAVEIEAIALGD